MEKANQEHLQLTKKSYQEDHFSDVCCLIQISLSDYVISSNKEKLEKKSVTFVLTQKLKYNTKQGNI